MKIVAVNAVGMFVLAVLSVLPASAETDMATTLRDELAARVAKLEKSCGRDVKKYCSSVTPGEGRILYCLQAYEDKISPKCVYELEETTSGSELLFENLKQAVSACRAEISGKCSTVQPGEGRIAACLLQNMSTASKECTEAVQKLKTTLAEKPDKSQ
jgi:Cysteine rich repeat